LDQSSLSERQIFPEDRALRKIAKALLSLTIAASFTFPVFAQKNPPTWEWQPAKSSLKHHKFFDKQNSHLFAVNAISQTLALIAIQSDGAHMESRGRTLDGFEKHFESYGYGWGTGYRIGGGIGLNMFSTLVFHELGHHKLERWVPLVGIVHAYLSVGYALSGSRQSKHGGW
jgi:hypothetical protein